MSAFFITAFLLGIGAFLVFYFSRTPSHQRRWTADQGVLPSISTYGDKVTIHNQRTVRYRSKDDYDVTYTHKTFNRGDICRVWFLVETFGPKLPFSLRAAHTLLSFELKDGTFVCISPEIRKKEGDHFSPWPGLMRQYEIMFVISDERDVVLLRTNHRKDDVWLYPLRFSPKEAQKVFSGIAESANNVQQEPKFFHTLWNNCATNITRLLRNVSASLPRWHYLYVFPGSIDTLLFRHNLIETGETLEKARERFFITKRAQEAGDVENFSKKIRSC